MRAWPALFAAIALEVTGTLSLKLFASQSWQLPLTYVLLAASYVLLAQAFRRIPVAVAFAVWEAAGLLLITLLGTVLLGEHLTPKQGLALLGLMAGAALLHRGTHESGNTSNTNTKPVRQEALRREVSA
ncbi:MAG: SMR family transporter [Deinococcus sp.]|uniref:DMT family transporter n=1 Tax=Deinococcus sp. TaxID=47478 RepID=UPI0026DCCC52|nr:SMR family transporter [Deinococcus sp.]MDO4246169.1 SMR family transporter [Deinococcus sp.]